MKKTILIFGSISGFLVSVFMVILSLWPSNSFGATSLLLGYASMILALSLVYVGVRNYRDKFNHGMIGFGKAFRVGLLISLLASTIYVVVWLVVNFGFVPDYIDRYTAVLAGQARASGVSGDDLLRQLEELDRMKNSYHKPVVVILYTYLEIVPVGIIISLLTALLVKRKRQEFDVHKDSSLRRNNGGARADH